LPDTFFVTKSGKIMGTGSRDVIGHQVLIEGAGLRAQLASQSIVTGQLVVSLSLRPETEFTMRGVDPEYPEIPTMPSGTAELMNKLQSFAADLGKNLDVEDIGARISGILKGVDEVANSEDLRNMLAGANNIVNDDDTQELTASLRASVDEIRAVAADAGSLMRNADGQIEVLAADLKPAVSRLVSVITEAEQTLAAAKEQMRGESVQMYQLEATLKELEGAATAIRQFFDYLERNPEALLSGK
jgi:paraquat-inducible protein B